MKNLFYTLILLLCLPALVWGHSARADKNLEKLTFDSTNQLKTVSSGGSSDVTNAGTFAVQEDGAALTALQLLDNMISGTGANISQLGGVAVSMDTGPRDAGTQRVTISTNDLVPISAASLPLPAGASTLANQQTDALTDAEIRATALPISAAALPLPTGAATSASQQTDALTDAEIRATALPVSQAATADITVQLEDADVAQANPLPVRLSDGTNFVDAAVLGTTTYLEGTTQASVIGCVRKDAAGSSVNTDNEIGPCQLNAAGDIRMDGSGVTQPVSQAATADITVQLEDADVAEANPMPVRLSDGTNFVDAAILGTTTYSEGTTKASVIGCVRKDALGSSVDTTNEIAPCQTNSDGLIRSTAGYPITEIAPFDLFNGAGETQIAATNLGASKAYALAGTGRIVKVCISVSLGTPFGEDMSIIFFDADPTITIEDTSLLVADAESAEAVISLTAGGFRDNFATVKLNCQTVDEPYDSITHVVFASEGVTTYDDEDIVLRLWVERKS